MLHINKHGMNKSDLTMLIDSVNDKTTIKKTRMKGDHLVCKKTINAYEIVALFGENLQKVCDEKDMTDHMKKYAISWPFNTENGSNYDEHTVHVCPDDQEFKKKFRANLVNEPYQTKTKGGVVTFQQNVMYFEDWDNKVIGLMSCKKIKTNEEILWYYGRVYPSVRDYFVYPPDDEYNRLQIRNNQIVMYEPMTSVPNWIGVVDEKYEKETVWYTQSIDTHSRVIRFELQSNDTRKSIKIPIPEDPDSEDSDSE
jgi:hypothetical protein